MHGGAAKALRMISHSAQSEDDPRPAKEVQANSHVKISKLQLRTAMIEEGLTREEVHLLLGNSHEGGSGG